MLDVTSAPGRARLLALMLAWRLYAVPCRCQGLTAHVIWDGVEEGLQVGQSWQKLREPATPRPMLRERALIRADTLIFCAAARGRTRSGHLSCGSFPRQPGPLSITCVDRCIGRI